LLGTLGDAPTYINVMMHIVFLKTSFWLWYIGILFFEGARKLDNEGIYMWCWHVAALNVLIVLLCRRFSLLNLLVVFSCQYMYVWCVHGFITTYMRAHIQCVINGYIVVWWKAAQNTLGVGF
jgi:hypothetical protein